MGVPIYTTPTVTLTFTEQGLDLTTAEGVFVTLQSGTVVLTKTGEELTVNEKSIALTLTQEESGQLYGTVRVQANWLKNGKRIASDVATIEMADQLLTEVIE